MTDPEASLDRSVILRDTIERLEEVAVVTKRIVTTGSVSVRTTTEAFEEDLAAELSTTQATVERVPVDRIVDEVPQTRTEDGVTIVPVFEEVLVVERRIRLVEELHIRHEATSESVRLPVTVRRQRAVVERRPFNTPATNPIERGMRPMSTINTSGEYVTGSQMVTAFFDDRSDAQAAVERIIGVGVPQSSIRMVAGADTTTNTTSAPARDRGFFEALGDLFMPDEDRHSYAEGLRRGGYLVTVPTTAANREEILDILDDEGTVDMDEREASWKSEGWSGTETGYVAPVRPETATGTGYVGSTEAYARMEDAKARRSADLTSGRDHDGTIEVMEESLKVGKRDVSLGRVRVRSYVVEEAVSEDVNLRSETVDIQRRVVDRPVDSFDEAFKDRTIELEETAEEAVVSKTARVVEEIDLTKRASERTQTVSDTLRRTEVDIEDERTGKLRTDEVMTAEERARRGL